MAGKAAAVRVVVMEVLWVTRVVQVAVRVVLTARVAAREVAVMGVMQAAALLAAEREVTKVAEARVAGQAVGWEEAMNAVVVPMAVATAAVGMVGVGKEAVVSVAVRVVSREVAWVVLEVKRPAEVIVEVMEAATVLGWMAASGVSCQLRPARPQGGEM